MDHFATSLSAVDFTREVFYVATLRILRCFDFNLQALESFTYSFVRQPEICACTRSLFWSWPSVWFSQSRKRRATQQTFSAINLASQQKTTRLFFSSQVRKQFKLLTVPLKPLHCCLRSDKLVNCHVWKFYKNLFLNFRVIWSVNQIALFNGFLSDFVEITSCVLCTYQCKSRGEEGGAGKGRGFDAWDYPPVGLLIVRSDPGVGTFVFDRQKPGINSEAVTKSFRAEKSNEHAWTFLPRSPGRVWKNGGISNISLPKNKMFPLITWKEQPICLQKLQAGL